MHPAYFGQIRRHACALAFACSAALALAACHQAPPPPSNVTPEKAVATSLRLTAEGDFDGLMRNRLPPAIYTQWRAEWDHAHAHPVPDPLARQQQFASIMQMLTQPNAEAKLARRLQPQLARMRSGKGSGLPIFAGIVDASGKDLIAASPQLGPSQKALAAQALAALVAWAQTADFSNAGKARKAIDLACATARQLHVQTLTQWRALDYAATMQDYGIIWNGLESVLQIYGVNLGKSLLDARVGAVASNTTHATVRLDINIAGKPLSAQWPMLKQTGHWYDVALLDAWQQAHPATTTSTAPAVATTTALPASSTGAAAKPAVAPSSTAPPASRAAPASARTEAH